MVERPPTDGGRPRKKKPKSRAFEDFESAGILIGFVSILVFWSAKPKTNATK